MNHAARQLAKMINIASEAHVNQTDRAGRPYILHALQVMYNLRSSDDELNCIAVAHDLIEDSGWTTEELFKLGFSNRIVIGIDALTKTGLEHKEYLKNILSNYDACRVKLADLKHNCDILRLSNLKEKDLQRLKKYYTMYNQIKDMVDWYMSSESLYLNKYEKVEEVIKNASGCY